MTTNGSSAKMPRRRYSGRKRPASSRERPRAICVRSLVPKEKKSATSAISPAVIAARGTSIMVPTVNGTLIDALSMTARAVCSMSSRRMRSSAAVPASGIMISGNTLTRSRASSQAAWMMASTCMR